MVQRDAMRQLQDFVLDAEATLRQQWSQDCVGTLRTLRLLAGIPWSEDTARQQLTAKEDAARHAMSETLALLDRIQRVATGKATLPQYRSLTRPSQKHLKVLKQQRVLAQQYRQEQLDQQQQLLQQQSRLLPPLHDAAVVVQPRSSDTPHSDIMASSSCTTNTAASLADGAGLIAVDEAAKQSRQLLTQLPIASPLRSYLVSRLHAATSPLKQPSLQANGLPTTSPMVAVVVASPDKLFFRELQQLHPAACLEDAARALWKPNDKCFERCLLKSGATLSRATSSVSRPWGR